MLFVFTESRGDIHSSAGDHGQQRCRGGVQWEQAASESEACELEWKHTECHCTWYYGLHRCLLFVVVFVFLNEMVLKILWWYVGYLATKSLLNRNGTNLSDFYGH